MEISSDSLNKIYEVEKIINCKFYKNKKYYLIKWLCYPISESTWEPKSSIKHLKEILAKFESEYPYSIDNDMYNIYCLEMDKRKKRSKRGQKNREVKNGIKLLSKKKKIEGFSKAELKDVYYEKLKNHLFINMAKRHINKLESQIIIDLSSTTTSQSGDNISIFINENENENMNETEEKNDGNKLIRPPASSAPSSGEGSNKKKAAIGCLHLL